MVSLEQPTSKPTKVRRTRAPRACRSCHERKVRCDVTRKEGTCTNCILDNKRCEVMKKKTRRTMFSYGIRLDPPDVSLSQSRLNQVLRPSTSFTRLNPTTSSNLPTSLPREAEAPRYISKNTTGTETSPHNQSEPQDEPIQVVVAQAATTKEPIDMATQVFRPILPDMRDKSSVQASTVTNGENPIIESSKDDQVFFTFYHFIDATNLKAHPPSDVAFLKFQGSLHLPGSVLLDEFIKHYFLHIHPFLPMFNEGNFWQVYHKRTEEPSAEHISLPVLYAMLFASCTFVCDTTMTQLGYPDIRSMRAAFFRRTKLLLDFGAEPSHLSLVLAVLPMSLSSMSPRKKVDVSWLTVAVENAKLAGAPGYPALSSSSDSVQRSLLKRL